MTKKGCSPSEVHQASSTDATRLHMKRASQKYLERILEREIWKGVFRYIELGPLTATRDKPSQVLQPLCNLRGPMVHTQFAKFP